MRNNAAQKVMTGKALHCDVVTEPDEGFGPAAVGHVPNGTALNVFSGRALRMYTEEEVSGILQVSLSQLRKWRMKENQGSAQGPPFKKIGRLVRYPEQGLLEFINSK